MQTAKFPTIYPAERGNLAAGFTLAIEEYAAGAKLPAVFDMEPVGVWKLGWIANGEAGARLIVLDHILENYPVKLTAFHVEVIKFEVELLP